MSSPYSGLVALQTKRYRTATAALMALTLGLAACGGASDTAPDADNVAAPTTPATAPATTALAEPLPTLVATTTIWADVVSRVTCGNLAEVITIIPAGADSHTFEPSLRDRATLSSADLIITNGLNLEESLLSTLDAVTAEGVPTFAISDAIPGLLAGFAHKDHDDHDDHGHSHDEQHNDEQHDDEQHDDEQHDDEGTDPHFWFDPTRVAAALLPLSAAIIESTDLNADQVQACTEQYRNELNQLDAELTALFATIPADRRTLVTNHDTLGYLADRYGLSVIGTVLGGSSSLAETNPAALEELAQVIIATGLPAIFAEAETSTRDINALANRISGLKVVTLFTESLDAPGTTADTYLGFLRTTATAIAEALGD